MNDEQQIRELIDRWSKAVREEDLDSIRQDHEPEMLMFDVPPPFEIRGIDEYMATWKTFFAWSARPIVFEFHDINVTAGADVAFATALGRCRGNEREGIASLDFRLTMGLRKRDGRWRIVHEHHSVPAID